MHQLTFVKYILFLKINKSIVSSKVLLMLYDCCRAQRGFKILFGLPPKRGLKYYVALQYWFLKYYGPREEVEDNYVSSMM